MVRAAGRLWPLMHTCSFLLTGYCSVSSENASHSLRSIDLKPSSIQKALYHNWKQVLILDKEKESFCLECSDQVYDTVEIKKTQSLWAGSAGLGALR